MKITIPYNKKHPIFMHEIFKVWSKSTKASRKFAIKHDWQKGSLSLLIDKDTYNHMEMHYLREGYI